MRKEETVDYHIRMAWHAIARMYNQQAAKFDADASMAMGFVLLNINTEEGTQATKIAPLMGLESRSLTRLLKTMEEKGLIYREADKVDKRSVRIRLTRKGKSNKEKARDKVLRFNEVVRNHVSEQDLEIFFHVSQTIIQLIEKNSIYDKE
jgi:DNA-binding MarR family transcriptional regulator